MSWLKTHQIWISTVAGVCAVVLAILCCFMRSELVRARRKSEKFDEFCSYVRTAVVTGELALRKSSTPGAPDHERDRYFENYAIVGNFGSRDSSDVALCATSPIDFKRIEQRYSRCTSDKFTCLADVFDEVLDHLPTRKELER